MATRINVTAIRDCPVADVQSVMRQVIKPACQTECPPLDVCAHGGWVWFTTSVWGVSAVDLNRGLCQLARPAVQFTSSDGSRWYLTVHGGPRGQEHFLHEFGYHAYPLRPEDDEAMLAQLAEAAPAPVDPRLAFLEDDPPPGPPRPRAPFDLVADGLAGVGGGVPDEFRAEVAQLPYSEAVGRFRVWHAERISAALVDAGIAHDRAALRAVLLWENLTDNERQHDLGNLPRLLSVLGLGGGWDEWVRQAEAPPPPEPVACAVDAPPPPPEDHIGPVVAIADQLELTPVEGGPVDLPLKDLERLRFFADACSLGATAGVVLTLALPEGFDAARLVLPQNSEGSIERTARGFRVGLLNHMWLSRRDLKGTLRPALCKLLYAPPDGSALECAFACAEHSALNQRYRGRVSGEVWHIEATYPRLTQAALAGALAFKRNCKRYEARDEAEAEALVAAAKCDANLHRMKVERQGLVVSCAEDIIGHLSHLVFRHRFRGYWDVAAVEREAAESFRQQQEMMRQMRRAGVEAARQRAAPHDAEVLHAGASSRFWRSDFTQLSELEQETRAKHDQALTGLGFRHLGDLVAKKQRDIVMRIHLAGDGLSYGVLMGKRTMYLGYEFFSRCANGSTLTTTTNAAHDSRPEQGVYFKVCPGLDAVQLHARHIWALGRFRTRRGTNPVPLPDTLAGCAAEVDAAFARQAVADAENAGAAEE